VAPRILKEPSFKLDMLITNQDATERRGHEGKRRAQQEQHCRNGKDESERYQHVHAVSIDLRRDVSKGCGDVTFGPDRRRNGAGRASQ